MSDADDFNQGVIAEFRANDGKVGGHFEHMVTNIAAKVELGDESYDATVVRTDDGERQRLYDTQVAIMPFFADYQVKAGDRVIPVLRLVRN